MDDLKAFRQLGSRTPGHPENFETAGVEVTTGLPLYTLLNILIFVSFLYFFVGITKCLVNCSHVMQVLWGRALQTLLD
jgi:hypothetical protein